MQIRILISTLMGGRWHEPGVGNYDPATAQHLIDIGAAEPYETKVIKEIKTKKKGPSLSVSQAAQVLRKKIVKKSKGKRK